MRKGDGTDGERAKVMGNFTTYDTGEESSCLRAHAFNSVGDEVNEIIMTHELTLV